MNIQTKIEPTAAQVDVSAPTTGEILTIDTGFQARSFKHSAFAGLMDPLIMVDHFTMTEPTFGSHAHAGMSAVSVLFEDSTGLFHNRDSLGHDIDLAPGDLYWLKAARGAVHNEASRRGSRTHALQVFVNLPARMKYDAQDALHVPAAEMPVIQGHGSQARLMLGQSNGRVGAQSPALPMTILDVVLAPGGAFDHQPGPDQGVWVYALDGAITVQAPGQKIDVTMGAAVALHGAAELRLQSQTAAHAAILHGTPIREPFVQRGPYAMSTLEDLDAVAADYAAGRLGNID